eukprot:TRINITY_DN40384_c0_g1_i1.p1 TRINITY_DN40384_c0_g1~~TRINITY_DN40384_c0_g1_i1.p1  ORF type:complete len:221 (+),score=96.22 TRINITY_DN40384_c0_g1_i1:81-743(+)
MESDHKEADLGDLSSRLHSETERMQATLKDVLQQTKSVVNSLRKHREDRLKVIHHVGSISDHKMEEMQKEREELEQKLKEERLKVEQLVQTRKEVTVSKVEEEKYVKVMQENKALHDSLEAYESTLELVTAKMKKEIALYKARELSMKKEFEKRLELEREDTDKLHKRNVELEGKVDELLQVMAQVLRVQDEEFAKLDSEQDGVVQENDMLRRMLQLADQ